YSVTSQVHVVFTSLADDLTLLSLDSNSRITPKPGQLNHPGITTAQQPMSATLGSAIQDTANITGLVNAFPTDTVTFNLYDNASASAPPVFTNTVTITLPPGGDTATASSGPYTPLTTGTFYWVATFNGDSNNLAVNTGPTDE